MSIFPQQPVSRPPSFSQTGRQQRRTWAPVRRARAWQRSHVRTASCAGRRCGGLSSKPEFEANPRARSGASCQGGACLLHCEGADGALSLHETGEPVQRDQERKLAIPGSLDRNRRVLHPDASSMAVREASRFAEAKTPLIGSTDVERCYQVRSACVRVRRGSVRARERQASLD